MENKEVMEKLEEIKGSLETSQKDKLKAAVDQMQAALETKNAETIRKAMEDNLKTVNDGLKELGDWRKEKTDADKENQKALDNLIVQLTELNKGNKGKNVKSFGEVFNEEYNEDRHKEMVDALKQGRKFKMELKSVGNMTLSNNLLSGDSVASYAPNQAILPGQSTNMRDYVRTVNSDTGLYVHYRESAGEGAIATQTEGSAKGQIDFDFTEVKTVNQYVAGFARVSNQVLRSLPYVKAVLPALLLREFFVAENSAFWTTVSGTATGSTTTVESDDVKQLMDLIKNQRKAKFKPSYVFISHEGANKINKLLYGSGIGFQGVAGVTTLPNGTFAISGVPVIAADWVADDKVLIIDSTFIERIEVEGLKLEFFEQDSDNVQKNLITARIECYEAINLMMPASAIYADMGNASF